MPETSTAVSFPVPAHVGQTVLFVGSMRPSPAQRQHLTLVVPCVVSQLVNEALDEK